ncbi:SDR family oxidoreductase [Shewanella sp. 10N.286.48.B5]|uniref:SDR family oxidoreductase n=1 Tax=Shewanella sp. 10N.286.48.B5 TaxID=1880834 RepID=UPI000C85833B|nr:SDR family oxidoreductase [Shewanella sp. 10N.286.48.B5]PMH88125.1 hypothetical protein BCU57_04885 [Shewanella sp. 10N.286.48.B5]
MNILITGTNSGFGKEMTITLAQLGHTVYAAMRNLQGKNSASGDELSALSETLSGQIIPLEMDVSSDDSVESAVAKALGNSSGVLDVVINNAGFFINGLNETFSSSQAHDMFNVNLFGPLRVMRSVLPALHKQGKGTIINVTSSANRFPMPGSGHYVASKAALESVTESYAYELAPSGIEALILQPGAFNTGIAGKGYAPDDVQRSSAYAETFEHMENLMPRFMALIEDTYMNQSPTMLADAVVDLLALPYGKRPLRTLVDTSGLGKQTAQINRSFEEAQKKFLHSIGLEKMAQVSIKSDK